MATTNSIRQGKRYKWLINGVAVIGIAVFYAGIVLDQLLAGLVVYAVLCGGAILAELYVRFGSEVPLADERQREIQRLASHVTLWLFGYAGFFALVGLFALDVVGARELGTAGQTLLYAFAVVYLSYGAIYLGLRYRR